MQVITNDDAVNAADDPAAKAEAAQAALAGFASVDEPDSKPAPVIEKPPEKTEAEKAAETKVAEETAAQELAEKEWEGVSPKQRQMLEAISEKVGHLDKIEHRLKGVEGRTGAALEGVHALKSAIDQAKEAAKTVTNAGGDAPTTEQISAASKSDEDWKQLLEDFPQWQDGIDKRIDHRVDARLQKLAPPPVVDFTGLKTELKTEWTGTVSEIVAKATAAAAEVRALTQIDIKHATWEQDIYVDGDRKNGEGVLTPEFSTWAANQTPEMRELITSSKPRDAIKMLDAFYAHRTAVAEATAKADRNKKRLESAITPKGVASASVNRNMTEEEAMYQGFISVDT